MVCKENEHRAGVEFASLEHHLFLLDAGPGRYLRAWPPVGSLSPLSPAVLGEQCEEVADSGG